MKPRGPYDDLKSAEEIRMVREALRATDALTDERKAALLERERELLRKGGKT